MLQEQGPVRPGVELVRAIPLPSTPFMSRIDGDFLAGKELSRHLCHDSLAGMARISKLCRDLLGLEGNYAIYGKKRPGHEGEIKTLMFRAACRQATAIHGCRDTPCPHGISRHSAALHGSMDSGGGSMALDSRTLKELQVVARVTAATRRCDLFLDLFGTATGVEWLATNHQLAA
jgi:hypothetical protein